MAKSCDFKTAEASTKAWFRKREFIDKSLNIQEGMLGAFREQNTYWSKQAFKRFHSAGIQPGDRLFYEEQGGRKAVPNKEMFYRIDAHEGRFYKENMKYANDIKTTSNINTAVKSGVLELFKSNPQLATIGTPQQYSQYLDTIFPDSQIKDIVYHFTTKENKRKILEEGFKVNKPRESDISFSKDNTWKDDYRSETVYSLLNIKNPKGYDRYSLKEKKELDPTVDGGVNIKTSDTRYATVVFEPEQIHILGSKQDMEGFKKFANNKSKELSDEFVDDLYNLNLTPDVIKYLYNVSSTNFSMTDYGFMLSRLVTNLKSQGKTFSEVLTDIKCL